MSKEDKSKITVVVGLSGGVDSSVTAKILVEEGYNVMGVFMKNWDDSDDPHCPAAIDGLDARNVAQHLNIPFYAFNFSKTYWDDVFSYFLEEHKKFRTPNPDILCNKYVKFKVFLETAEKLGADFIATGHYARNFFNPETELFELRTPMDANKDQTYFLYTLGQKALRKTLFPLADLPKPEIRKIAKEVGFLNAEKKDSTGICFVGERDYMEFLKKYLHQTPGDIVAENGQIIGKHIGLSFYTLGQRKNLNIGGVRDFPELPWFVLEKNIKENQIVACQDANNPKLFTTELLAEKLDWVAGFSPLDQNSVGAISPSEKINLLCKIRYRQESQKCEISWKDEDKEILKVTFEEPQRAITPGQAIVFYDEDEVKCLGGGEIC